MERHFHEQLETLKQQLIDMAMAVEEAIASAIEALIKRDNHMADQVMNRDEHINRMEIDIDEICLKLLALQQPMAIDLRFVTSAMKLNNDLERIGDHATNIGEEVIYMIEGIIPRHFKTREKSNAVHKDKPPQE